MFFCIFTQVWKSQYQSQSRPSSLSLDLGLELLTFLGLDLSLESRPDMGKVSISVSVSKMLVSTAAARYPCSKMALNKEPYLPSLQLYEITFQIQNFVKPKAIQLELTPIHLN